MQDLLHEEVAVRQQRQREVDAAQEAQRKAAAAAADSDADSDDGTARNAVNGADSGKPAIKTSTQMPQPPPPRVTSSLPPPPTPLPTRPPVARRPVVDAAQDAKIRSIREKIDSAMADISSARRDGRTATVSMVAEDGTRRMMDIDEALLAKKEQGLRRGDVRDDL